MRAFLTSLLLFALFAAFFYMAALLVLPSFIKQNVNYKKGAPGYLYSRIKEIRTAKNTDLLFLGSSKAYRGFDPRIFEAAGYRSFNLGSSNQTPIQTYLLVKKYLTQINPKKVILEVNPQQFSNDGVESSLDLIANDTVTMATVKMAAAVNNIKTYNTLLYGLFRQVLGADKTFREDPVSEKDRYVKGGFVEREMEYFHSKNFKPKELKIVPSQLEHLDQTLKYIKERGIEVILVQAPITASAYRSYLNNDEFDSTIESRKLPYWNFNELMQLDDSLDFYDSHHLNQNGVRLFNAKLIQLLKECSYAG